MTSASFAAVDLGAESGRVILGVLKDQKLQIEEINRFPNGGIRLGDDLYWDFLNLWRGIKAGLAHAADRTQGNLGSIGVDTWGVDFAFLDANDRLIGNPVHYRDSRTNGMMAELFQQIPRDEIYAQTGIQFMQLNTLFQIYAMARAHDPALAGAKTFLNIPDLINFYLTGVKASEFTIATTTQFYNPIKRAWATDLLQNIGVSPDLFGDIVDPGTELGSLRPDLASELGLPETRVIASAGHDTASAVAAVPAATDDYIYLSSGTWSLMGVELDEPLITPDSLAANMTNEGGLAGTFRFLKNIIGLWLVQECKRIWAQEGADLSYGEITALAAKAPAHKALINAGSDHFLAPARMPDAIQSFCADTGQLVPTGKGEIVRCALESLALEYRWVAEQIDALTGQDHPTIHIIGGGTQNKLLNQFAANATGRTVITGPIEATAIGNILVQAIATGEIASLAEGREIVRNSFDVETYAPQDGAAWDEAYKRYQEFKER
jgi:rhamnulokinase